MKKIVAIASCVLLAVALLATVYICVFVQTGRWEERASRALFCPGIDFSMRMNEAACVVDGVDPYDVWTQSVVKAPYYPQTSSELRRAEFWAPINAYTPWEYPVMMPLLFLPRQIAWCLFYGSMLLCVLALFLFSYKRGKEPGDRWDALIVAALPILTVIHPVFVNLCVGNWTLHILLAIVGMVYFLNRGKDGLAGICWAFAMVKPQLALLLAVPLLWRRKWKTCLVAVGICILASLPILGLTGKSMLTLLREAPAASVHAFYGCGTMPYFLFRMLPVEVGGACGMLIGFVFCVVLTGCVRSRADWLFFALPAVVCSVCWTYSMQYSQALGWILLICFLLEYVKRPHALSLIVLLPFLLLSVSRLYRCLYGVATVYGISALDWIGRSEEMMRGVDSLNSSMTLILLVLFCAWIMRHDLKTKRRER